MMFAEQDRKELAKSREALQMELEAHEEATYICTHAGQILKPLYFIAIHCSGQNEDEGDGGAGRGACEAVGKSHHLSSLPLLRLPLFRVITAVQTNIPHITACDSCSLPRGRTRRMNSMPPQNMKREELAAVLTSTEAQASTF